MEFIGIIPARYKSKRFPGKPIASLLGKPMIWHVYNSALNFDKWKCIYVATDDERIESVCNQYDMPCIMTRADHPDCIDRATEVAIELQRKNIIADKYIIMQGDEPLFDSSILNADLSPSIVNFYTDIHSESELYSPNTVKVIVSKNMKAIYYSRYTIPFHGSMTTKGNYALRFFKQLGIYAFSIEALTQFHVFGMSYLEGVEGIGMLRFLENDVDVHMRYAKHDSLSVDTPEDLEAVEKIMQ